MLKITEPTWLHVIIPHMNGQLLIKQENIYIRYDTYNASIFVKWEEEDSKCSHI